jgi:hypothetical protein
VRLALPALVVLWASAARAESQELATARSVVIVFEPRTRAVSERLRQEIEAMGFQVLLQPESEQALSLEQIAANGTAIAAIRVKPLEAGGVAMTVLDRATGKTVHRELARASASDPAGEELVATRTVELFRASLMELEADHPARGDLRPPEPIRARLRQEASERVRERSGALSLAGGPALLVMPSWQPSPQFWLAASFSARSGLGLSAALLSPLGPARLSRSEGSVDVRATTYRLGLTFDTAEPSQSLSARLSAGWSLTTASASARASSPYIGLQSDFVTTGPWLAAAGRIALTSQLALTLECSALFALPRQTLRFAEREVGDFAQPALFAALGPELSWP